MINDEDRIIYKFCLTKEELRELTQEIADEVAKNHPIEQQLFSKQQAWEFLGIGKTLFRQLEEEGEFEVIKYTESGNHFFTRKTLLDFQERKTQKRL